MIEVMVSKRIVLLVGITSVALGSAGIIKLVSGRSASVQPELQKTTTNQVLSAIGSNNKQQTATLKENSNMTNSIGTAELSNNQKLIWQQDFSIQKDGAPDSKYWNIADSSLPIYNQEEQVYSLHSNNVRISGGKLILEARKTSAGISSGRIDTKGKQDIEQGSRLEARIRLPKGMGAWPAFWLLSANQPHTSKLNPTDSDWQQERFYMLDGEVDIMEAYGRYPGVIESTVHTFAKSQEKQQTITDLPDGFHTYWLEWHDDRLIFGVDDEVYNTYSKDGDTSIWPFTDDNKMYIILNLAIGGSGGGQIVQSPNDVWRMEVESIKYYKL